MQEILFMLSLATLFGIVLTYQLISLNPDKRVAIIHCAIILVMIVMMGLSSLLFEMSSIIFGLVVLLVITYIYLSFAHSVLQNLVCPPIFVVAIGIFVIGVPFIDMLDAAKTIR